MIANLLPNEATHSSLDLFEKQPLLITFENAFDQKIGLDYSPNGPMLEFEITGDRNNFVDLQKNYLEIRCKVTQSNGADLRYVNTDPTVSDSPFLVNNSLYSLFSDCTLSANGLKISNANSNFAHKSFIGTEFSNSKGAKDSWLKCQGCRFENNPAAIDAADFTSQRELVRESREIWFYDPLELIFSHVTSICWAVLPSYFPTDVLMKTFSLYRKMLPSITSCKYSKRTYMLEKWLWPTMCSLPLNQLCSKLLRTTHIKKKLQEHFLQQLVSAAGNRKIFLLVNRWDKLS